MRLRALVIHSAAAGAGAGLLALGLVLRLNPELRLPAWRVGVAAVSWAAWGVVGMGLPLAAVMALLGRDARERGRAAASATAAMAVLLALAGVLARVNADLYRVFLSGSGHRLLGQDAVALWAGALLVAAAARWAGRHRRAAVCWGGIALAVSLPLARVMWQPSPPPAAGSAAPPVPAATRPLLVVGVEGLDVNFLLRWAGSGRYPALEELLARGAWGEVRAYRPYLRASLWTSLATGCYPRRHGVKMRRTVRVAGLGEAPVRLLPWTPLGHRWFLPPWTRPGPAPEPWRPPLWVWLEAGRERAVVLAWPAADRNATTGAGRLPQGLRPALEEALGRVGARGRGVLEALERDAGRVEAAVAAMASGPTSIWVRLGALVLLRERFEPTGPERPEERVVLELGVEALDGMLAALGEAWGGRGPVAVVSPVGLREPRGWEAVVHLLGGGAGERVSPAGSPPGIAVVVARGTVPGRRFAPCQVVDLAPTLTYLLDVPLPTWVEGRVILESVDSAYLSAHPLRVAE